MDKPFRQIIRVISNGDTTLVEQYFRKPGGRKYLENLTLMLINGLPCQLWEKENFFRGFIAVLNRMEQRICRQQEGSEILNAVFSIRIQMNKKAVCINKKWSFLQGCFLFINDKPIIL